MLDGLLFTLAGLAKRTRWRRVRQRCAGLYRTGLAGPPQDGPQNNIAAEFSVAADAAIQNRAKRDFGLYCVKTETTYIEHFNRHLPGRLKVICPVVPTLTGDFCELVFTVRKCHPTHSVKALRKWQ